MKKRIAAIAAAALCVIVAADVARAAPSKGEFIRRGDLVCARYHSELTPLNRRIDAAAALPPEKVWPALARLWGDYVRMYERYARRFGAVGVPRDDLAATRLVANVKHGIVPARRLHVAFLKGDEQLVERAGDAYVRFQVGVITRMRAYGFRICGK